MIKNKIFFNYLFFVSVFLLFVSPYSASAADFRETIFNVDKNFDASARSQISTVMIKNANNIYFNIEKSWWEAQPAARQIEILNNLEYLSVEFDKKIYPTLTSVFGSEWKPGVDGENKITILFHSMKDGVNGYFRSADEYLKLQAPDSNEKEMLYLSITKIDDSQLKAYLSHEFVHLITFNQKNRLRGVDEDIWLNEARADYASTILGYDDIYDGSNLQRRARDFLKSPSDALTEWQETKYDYGVVNLFTHYLVDHYSISILADSLKSKSVGINSINEALLAHGIQEDFAQIFTNWTIANVVNDCSVDLKYCYFNPNLKNLRINPVINFLPISGNSSLSVSNATKKWSGNWQKIIGGDGDLKVKFSSLPGLDFKVPYILFDRDNNYSVGFFSLDDSKKGEISVKEFGSKFASLIIMPSLQSKDSISSGLEPTYPYTFTASVGGVPSQGADQTNVQNLLAQIEFLKKKIAILQAYSVPTIGSCVSINHNLYFGILNSSQVNCLQQFLKNQGIVIYPEGLITGNFWLKTRLAVMRFQKKYNISATGFVGPVTRAKINQILNER